MRLLVTVLLLALGICGSLRAENNSPSKTEKSAADSGPDAHFSDPDSQLPTTPAWARKFNDQLNRFEQSTGVKIVARLFLKGPPANEDSVPGAYMRALAKQLGVAKRGALVAYFAADDDWRVWIGDETTSAFLGRTATPEDLVEEGALHKVKESLLDGARASGDAAFQAEQKAAPPDQPPAPQQRLKFQTAALLDGLMHKLEAPAKTTRQSKEK